MPEGAPCIAQGSAGTTLGGWLWCRIVVPIQKREKDRWLAMLLILTWTVFL